MSKINTVYNMVLKVLNNTPEARGNDNLLIVTIDKMVNPVVADMPYMMVMSNRAHFGLPSCETIRRARQKAQETHPELKPSKRVQDIRKDEEIQFENFALTV